jgi:hypothetical protein
MARRKAMTEEKNGYPLAAAILAGELTKETQSYLQRGRQFQGLTDAQLTSKWIVDFRTWRASRSDTDDPGNSAAMEDTAAELRLRKLEPPYEQVRDEVNAMIQEIERIGQDQPSVSAKVQQFLDDLSKRKY